MALAIKNRPLSPSADDDILVDGMGIHIRRPLTLRALVGAAKLSAVAPGERQGMLERFIDIGGETCDVARSTVAVQLLEEQVRALGETVTSSLLETMAEGRAVSRLELEKTLGEFSTTLTSTVGRFMDPESQVSIPSIVREQVATIAAKLFRDVNTVVTDDEQGALAKIRSQIVREIHDANAKVLSQLAVRTALLTRSNHGGTPYEEAVTEAASILLRASNDVVERCGDAHVAGRRAAGDVLVTLNPMTTGGDVVRIVIESKERGENAQRFSRDVVAKALRESRSARGAQSGIFVASHASVLPDGLPFGQVGPGDYFTVYDPVAGDDIGLAAALYLAKAHALTTLQRPHNAGVDVSAAQRTVQALRDSIERLMLVDGEHSRAMNAIKKAGSHCEDLRTSIIGHIRELDNILTLPASSTSDAAAA